VGDGGRAGVVVGSSPPHRPAWVRARQICGVMMWCGALATRSGPLRGMYFACMDLPLWPSSHCLAVYINYVLLVYRWWRDLGPLHHVSVIYVLGYFSDGPVWHYGSCRQNFPSLRVLQLPGPLSSLM
jgi:hypothetical protein